MSKIGIVGYSELGQHIASEAVAAGLEVMAWDSNAASLGAWQEAVGQIETAASLEGLAACDLVLETLPDELEAKKAFMAEASQALGQVAALATSTGGHCVSEIAAAAGDPSRVVGLHFLPPPQGDKLVEVVRGLDSSPQALEAAAAFCQALGRETVVVKDSPGFIVNYLFAPYMNQALDAYDHGLASKQDLDTALHLGLGYPQGPLALINQIGLDEHLELTRALYERLGDQRFAPPAILQRMVAAGKLGDKSGGGF